MSASSGPFVISVAHDPRESQRDASGVAGRALGAVEGNLDDLLGAGVDDVALPAGLRGEEPLGLPGEHLVLHSRTLKVDALTCEDAGERPSTLRKLPPWSEGNQAVMVTPAVSTHEERIPSVDA